MQKPLIQLTDKELIGEFQGGTDDAFVVLAQRYKDPLTNFAFRLTGNPSVAPEIVRDAFVRWYRRRHVRRGRKKFPNAMYALVAGCALPYLRMAAMKRLVHSVVSKREREPLFDIPGEARRDAVGEEIARENMIQNAFQALPLKSRTMLVLRDVQDLSYEDVAEIAGLRVETARSRIVAAREQLQLLIRTEKEQHGA